MWSTFKDCLDTILSNLDDFAIIIFILIVGNKLAELLYRFIANFLERSIFTAQSIKLSLQIFIGVISFVHLVGENVVNNASAGIAIGVGYAFQPYIISMFNGLMLHNDNIINGNVWLDVPSAGIKGGKVYSIGLFNTILLDRDGNKILITNSSLTSSSVTVKTTSPWTTAAKSTVPTADAGAHDDSRHYLHYQIHHNPVFASRND